MARRKRCVASEHDGILPGNWRYNAILSRSCRDKVCINQQTGVSFWHLACLNGIPNPDFIRSGRTICVRGTPPVPPPPCGYWYTVKWGDTLWKIGRATGWGVWQLAAVNHIPNPDKIWAGQKLWIPCH